MMTFEEFKQIPAGTVFAQGELANSPEGIFMTNNGGTLRWLAKKGQVQDWAIYCHWANRPWIFIEKAGDKVTNKEHIRRCVPCDDEMLKHYRY